MMPSLLKYIKYIKADAVTFEFSLHKNKAQFKETIIEKTKGGFAQAYT